jgi:hypothetical protein
MSHLVLSIGKRLSLNLPLPQCVFQFCIGLEVFYHPLHFFVNNFWLTISLHGKKTYVIHAEGSADSLLDFHLLI